MKQFFISSLIFIGVKLGAYARRLNANETVSIQHHEDKYESEGDYLVEYGDMGIIKDYMNPYSGEGK